MPAYIPYFAVIAAVLGAIVLTITPVIRPPTVTTLAATYVTATTSELNGRVNPNGAVSTAWFRYSSTSPMSCSDTFGVRVPTTGGVTIPVGTTSAYSEMASGLTASTTYYYCAIASNARGVSTSSLLSFITLPR